jgi:uncharacterized protein (TIGR03083 family)
VTTPPRSATPYDVIVVGARCAGSTAATVLARAGRRVLLLDRDDLPSDTLSTHQLFPDSLDLLDRLGVGDRLRARHRLHPTGYSWRVLGHAIVGEFSPVGDHTRTMSVRRIALDAALLDTALDAGAEVRLDTLVEGLVGAGTVDDPVRGVVLADGERVHAPWVVGADGRSSTVARRLGVEKSRELRGEMAMLLGYWKGLPATDVCQIDVREQHGVMSAPCEDGFHLLSVAGPPTITSGSAQDRQRAYLDVLRKYPGVLNRRLLERAEQVGPVLPVPETMLRGYVRQGDGPGWALVGDAASFKHPVTAQGIGDALAQGWYVGEALGRGDGLEGYDEWRSERDAGHYDWSFVAARFPTPAATPIYAGLAEDDVAGQEYLDMFAKGRAPRDVITDERTQRWHTAWVYETGIRELVALVEDLGDDALAAPVPACPEWDVAALVAHLVGVAEDSARAAFYDGAADAWRDPALATAREAWTAAHVERRPGRDREALLRDLDVHAGALVAALRRGGNPVAGDPAWGRTAPVADLAAHLADLREALGLPPDTTGPLARFGFAVYRDWLHLRLVRCGLPALRLDNGHREWLVGEGEPAGSVTAEPHELYRVISGRRGAAAIAALPWTTDPTPYLSVISPYPLPD